MVSWTSEQEREYLDSLKDPEQQIFLLARVLDSYRNMDYEGKGADQLSDNELALIVSRRRVGAFAFRQEVEIAVPGMWGQVEPYVEELRALFED